MHSFFLVQTKILLMPQSAKAILTSAQRDWTSQGTALQLSSTCFISAQKLMTFKLFNESKSVVAVHTNNTLLLLLQNILL